LSCREVFNGEVIKTQLKANQMLSIDDVEGPYSENQALRDKILNRGL
jgi:hypothetical protein